MRRRGRARTPRSREPVVALINVVFLLLVFFLVAGTLAPPVAPDVTLARTDLPEFAAPADALVLHTDGSLSHRGVTVSAADWRAEDGIARIVPDRAAPATRLIEVARALRAAGADRVFVVTEQGL